MDVQIADFSSAEPIRSSILNTIVHKDHYVEAKLRMLGASERPMSEQDILREYRLSPVRELKLPDQNMPVRGPFTIPLSVDGVWMHRPVLVTEDEMYRSRIQLSANVFALSTTPSLVIGGKPLRMERDCSMKVTFVEEDLSIPVLLDTGAAPNVITAGLWTRLGYPTLNKSDMSLVVADQSSVRVMGRTSEVEFELETGITMRAEFYVIPSKGLEQAILGREFMRKYRVVIDVANDTMYFGMPDAVDRNRY